MSEILYVKISTQNIVCSHRETDRERGREREEKHTERGETGRGISRQSVSTSGPKR